MDAAEAFIFVTPEYNYSFSPALKNALDYLNKEWWRKPLGFVSYGGVSGGTRGVAGIMAITSALGLVRVGANVELNFGGKQVVDGVFQPQEKETAILEKRTRRARHPLRLPDSGARGPHLARLWRTTRASIASKKVCQPAVTRSYSSAERLPPVWLKTISVPPSTAVNVTVTISRASPGDQRESCTSFARPVDLDELAEPVDVGHRRCR